MIKGFSKLSAEEKARIVTAGLTDPEMAIAVLKSFYHADPGIQSMLSEFSENTLSNHPLPYGIAPNFLINGNYYFVPMVTEESSVVAASSSAARYWAERGGFRAMVKGTEKTGQLHFLYRGDPAGLMGAMPLIDSFLRNSVAGIIASMEKRGGGILRIGLKDRRDIADHLFQLHVVFDTVDAMGANFINTVLEEFRVALGRFFDESEGFDEANYEPLMAILSNFTPDCLVEVSVECSIEDLGKVPGMGPEEFARRFVLAVKIATEDVYRATTHNKGIMNGVDAVVLATGNDFRAVEAGIHAWAARDGTYASLSRATAIDGMFRFSMEIPLALGTVGGLTRLHPLAALSLDILGRPTAKELMMVAAAAGLANNFAALKALVTSGIQAGHMKMHLSNMLHELKCTKEEAGRAEAFFAGKKISYKALEQYLKGLRTTDAANS